MSSPIVRLTVGSLLAEQLGNGSVIRWQLGKDWCTKELEFAVLVGRAAGGPFARLGLTEDTLWVDPAERRRGVSERVYYTVVTRDKQTDERWRGPVQRVGSVWTDREWLLARELARREQLRLVKGLMGVEGRLLIRRTYGQACSCISPDTGMVKDPSCQLCYGTGWLGGFYPAVPLWVDQEPQRVMRRLDADQGLLSQVVSTWRILSYPPIEPNDVWADLRSDRRWAFGTQVVAIAQIRGEPIIQQVQVELLERERPEYGVPIDG